MGCDGVGNNGWYLLTKGGRLRGWIEERDPVGEARGRERKGLAKNAPLIRRNSPPSPQLPTRLRKLSESETEQEGGGA